MYVEGVYMYIGCKFLIQMKFVSQIYVVLSVCNSLKWNNSYVSNWRDNVKPCKYDE